MGIRRGLNKRRSLEHFWRQTLIVGGLITTLAVLSGVVMIFWREYGFSYRLPAEIASRLLIQATLGPIYIAVTWLLPLTLPLLLIAVTMIFVSARFRWVWLSLLTFALIGMYWLWMVHLISTGAFD